MIQQIHEHCYFLKAQKPSAHSVLLTGTENTLIDVGTREQFPHLKSQLDELGIKKIDRIVLTHAHYDHSGALEQFPDAKIYASLICGIKLRYDDDMSIYALKYQCQPPKLEYFNILSEGDIFVHGEYSFQVLMTPGHSDDGLCLFEPNLALLLSGDTVFARGIPALITHSGSDGALLSSVKKLQKLPIDMIIPGHGHIETNAKESLLKTEQQILKRIQQTNQKIIEEAKKCPIKKY